MTGWGALRSDHCSRCVLCIVKRTWNSPKPRPLWTTKAWYVQDSDYSIPQLTQMHCKWMQLNSATSIQECAVRSLFEWPTSTLSVFWVGIPGIYSAVLPATVGGHTVRECSQIVCQLDTCWIHTSLANEWGTANNWFYNEQNVAWHCRVQ